MAIKETIQQIRADKGITQEQMAHKLYVTRQAVSRWETGETQPGIDMLKLIAATFDVPMMCLLEMPEGNYCQSCGMPFYKEEYHGTEADGSRAEDYCSWCYTDGKYTSDETMDEMIEKNVPYMCEGTGMTAEDAVSFMGALYPNLERWKGGVPKEANSTKYGSTLVVVSDMERSVAFYEDVLGLHVIDDFGANKVLDCGIALQTIESYEDFIDGAEITFGGNDSELYFEEGNFDGFARRLEEHDISYVHPVKEHSWGQRAVRFYDPDCHIIEVGEQMESVVSRFIEGGMTPQQVAERMDVPLDYVQSMMCPL